ncbi:MAG: amidohydrolase family protein, partial [Bryobacteraceae bacterium]
ALRLAGIDRSTPDPPGGIAVRDARGNPTGILKGAARELVERVIPPPSEEQIVTALEEAQAYANARGVTSVRDISCTPGVPRAYRTMFRTGRLTVRVTCALLGSGSTPPFGSDWDNGSMNVMKGIYEAVTRRTPAPGRKITVEEAVRAYCAGRSIEPGKLADFVVLSNDIFSIDPSKIPGTEVLATIFNGVPVYGYLSPLRDKSGLILR